MNDILEYNLTNNKWNKIITKGNPPKERGIYLLYIFFFNLTNLLKMDIHLLSKEDVCIYLVVVIMEIILEIFMNLILVIYLLNLFYLSSKIRY